MIGRVVFEADDAKMIWSCRRFCPISDHQFRVAATEQISIESVREQDKIVVGFALEGDLKVLGITLPAEKKRDLQVHFNAQRCSESDLVGRGLPELDAGRPEKSGTLCTGQVYSGGCSQRSG